MRDAPAHAELAAAGIGGVGRRVAADLASARILGRRDGLLDHLARLVDGPLDAGFDHRQTGEPLLVTHTDVGGEDHRRRAGDDGRIDGDHLAGALRLHVQLDAGGLGGLLEPVRSHEGVRDARGACGDRDQHRLALGSGSGRGCRSSGNGCFVGCDGLVHQGDDLIGRGGVAQAVGELRTHQVARQLGEQCEVRVAGAVGGRDQEGDVGGSVEGPEVDRRVEPGERQRVGGHGRGATVRNGDSATEPGGSLGFARQGVRLEPGRGRAPGLADELGEIVDHVVLGWPKIDIEHNQISNDQVLRHGCPFVFQVSRGR